MIFVLGKDYEKYRKGKLRWRLLRQLQAQTSIMGYDVYTDFIKLTPEGLLTLEAMYAIDGVTRGIDSAKSLRAAFLHDALFQLIAIGLLPKTCRPLADEIFLYSLMQDGFPKMWAVIRFYALRFWWSVCPWK